MPPVIQRVLALLHAMRALDDLSLAMPSRLLLFSPSIGVSRFAVMTNISSLLSPLPGLEKAAWLDVMLFSLGHLAVPRPLDDPMYGLTPRRPTDGLALAPGFGAPSGEAGALAVPLGQFARLRSNPFFPLIVDRIDAALNADAPMPGAPSP